MTSQHTADYPTLQEVLRLPVFAGCTVCGGAAGLGRRVSGVNLTDTPDYARWLAQGELLITTGLPSQTIRRPWMRCCHGGRKRPVRRGYQAGALPAQPPADGADGEG